MLEIIKEDGLNTNQRAKANSLLDLIQTFYFVFILYTMKTTLKITKWVITSIIKEISIYHQCHEFG